ncbi:hypothetical protein HN747_03825 [archaeon]|jgi:hypothetical protein|nr:hypothetical protein [archaeon]
MVNTPYDINRMDNIFNKALDTQDVLDMSYAEAAYSIAKADSPQGEAKKITALYESYRTRRRQQIAQLHKLRRLKLEIFGEAA